MKEKRDNQAFDLEERLLEFSVRIIKLVEQLPNTRAGNHVAGQVLRSGTSPYPNHGEAQAAESRRDFIHKLHISLKELRETSIALRIFLASNSPKKENKLPDLIDECNQLTVIFQKTVTTARTRKS